MLRLASLTDDETVALRGYEVRVASAYPDGSVLLPFPRLFIIATG